MQNKFIEVQFQVNPLGNLEVEWLIPGAILKNNPKFDIEVPGFKYDLPTFASIPVPFSSKGIELTIEEVVVSEPAVVFEVRKGTYGNKILTFDSTANSGVQDLIISYTIKQIVNHDGIYFVIVYPFRSPFFSSSHRISIATKFSYNIRRYKFWERHFTYPHNEKIISSDVFTSKRMGDEITVTGDYTPVANETLDLHLTATRFPFLIRRDIFWFIVFLIFLLLTLSPYIVTILD